MTQRQSVFLAVEEVARQFSERPALSGAGRHWTYGQLIEDVERLAFALVERGCRPGTRVAVVAGNNPLTPLVWLAAARVGAVVSLVNFMLRTEELATLLNNLEPQLLCCDADRLDVCKSALERVSLNVECVVLEEGGYSDAGRAIAQSLTGRPYQGPHPCSHDAHEISYTSGTTSAPKGAVLTHETVLHRGDQEVALFGLGPDDAAIVVTPLFHQSGIRDTVLVMWLVGGHAVIAPKFDAATFWPMVKQYRATYCCMVETILLFLERHPVTEEERYNPLRRVLGNGEPEMLARMEERFGLRFVTVYGMTENGVPVAVPMNIDKDELQMLRRWRRGAFLAGWPQTDTEIRLVGENGVVSGEGATGEIQIRSRNLFREYYRDPKATRAAFTEGWFRTGDMGMYGPLRALYFLDRIKDVIRRGGENIASKEVETVLNSHPSVKNVAVVPVPDPLFQQEVKAIVIPHEGVQITPADLWRWCEDRLARYKVPRYIEFRDSLPMSGTGRIQKQVLRAEGIAGRGITYDRRQETARA
jgi:acyl-CoA synthetase (AMP-forming)/AMP-acid ligase II